MALRIQRPTPPNEWMYEDRGESDRYFTKYVILGKNAEPWQECTNEEKEQWEHDHQPEQPEQVQEAEVVNE